MKREREREKKIKEALDESQPRAKTCESQMATVPGLESNQNKKATAASAVQACEASPGAGEVLASWLDRVFGGLM